MPGEWGPRCLFSTCTGRDECCAWPAGSAAAPSGSQGTREGGAHTRNVHCVAQRRWRSGHCGHIDWDAGNLRPQLANRKAHHRSQFALNQPPVMPTKPQRLDGRAPHSRNALTPSPKTKALRQIHHRGRNLCHRRYLFFVIRQALHLTFWQQISPIARGPVQYSKIRPAKLEAKSKTKGKQPKPQKT